MTFDETITASGFIKLSEGRCFYLQESTGYVHLTFHTAFNRVNETFEKVKAPFCITFDKSFFLVTVKDLTGSANTVLIHTTQERITI